MHFHRRVLARVFVATFSADFDDIAAHVLAFFSKDAGDVCCGTRAECDEQELNW